MRTKAVAGQPGRHGCRHAPLRMAQKADAANIWQGPGIFPYCPGLGAEDGGENCGQRD